MYNVTATVNLAADAEARPVAELVQIASRYESRIHIIDGNKKINAKSIMGMMSLGIFQGARLDISAEGADEQAAVEEIAKYIESGK